MVETNDDNQGTSDLLLKTTVTGPDGASVLASNKTCKCGSTKHLRTRHTDCPLRKDKQVSDTSIAEKQSRKCGSTENLRRSHHDCLFILCTR